MPTNRKKRIIKRRVTGHNRAVVEKLISGHWWEFLVPRDEDVSEPDEKRLAEYWGQYRDAILGKVDHPWASKYFDCGVRDRLEDWSEWIQTDRDRQAVSEGCYFDWHSADRVVQFLRRFCRHSKGQFAGMPFEPARWQREELIYPAYGWRRADGTRRYRTVYCEVPKKNGKSTLCSGLSLYHLIGDREPGAEVYSAANDRDQASIIFNESKNMVLGSPILSQLLDIIDSKKEIRYHRTASVIRALSADVPTKDGLNISAGFVDEMHAMRDDRLFKTLRYGGASRRQPLMVVITTAGEERRGICWRQHQYAERIQAGILQDNAFLPLLYSADADRDREETDYWQSVEAWEAANPSLDETIGRVQMEIDCRAAQESPEAQADFKRYRLNLWGQKSQAWLRMDRWVVCAGDGEILPVDYAPQAQGGAHVPERLRGMECYAGLDLASRSDVAALALDFLFEGKHIFVMYFWAPEEGAHVRQQRDQVPYLQWAQEGYMELTPGGVTDYDVIRQRIRDIAAQCRIRMVAVDRWNSTQLQTQLKEDGLEVVEFGQGFASMSSPTRDYEAAVIESKIVHGRHPVLRWMAANAIVKRDAAGNMKPDKANSAEKIDGIVASLMAFDCANRLKEEEIIYSGELVMV